MSVHTDPAVSEWGGGGAAYIASGSSPVVEVHTMLGCGTSPEDITSGL